MYTSHFGSFRIKVSRNVHDVQKLVQELLQCLSLFDLVLGVVIEWNKVVKCLIHIKISLRLKRSDMTPQLLTNVSLRRTLLFG